MLRMIMLRAFMLRAIKRLQSRGLGEIEIQPCQCLRSRVSTLNSYVYLFRIFRVSCPSMCNMKRTASYLPLGVLVLHILLASAKSLTGGAYEISLESSEGLKEVEKSLNKTLGLLSKQGLRIPYSSC